MPLAYKLFLGGAFISLLIFVLLLIMGMSSKTGPYLSLFFILLALGFQGIGRLKGFSYAVCIFAAVTISMYFPQFFLKAGDFELKGLIVPLLQIIMFGMGSQMSVRDFAGVIKMPKGVLVG